MEFLPKRYKAEMTFFRMSRLEVYFIPSKYERNWSAESEVKVFFMQCRKVLTAEHCNEFKWLYLSDLVLQ